MDYWGSSPILFLSCPAFAIFCIVDGEGVSGVRLTDRIGIGVLTRLVHRDLVDEVLAETGRVEQRSRSLPARVVVYYVLGLCLFFGESYEEVMRLLGEGLRFAGSWRKDWKIPTTGAISQARQRLGADPVRVCLSGLPCPARSAVPREPGCDLAG